MKKYTFIFIAFLFVSLSCKFDKNTITPDIDYHPSWTYLGLSDKYVLRLRLFKPYLYACTKPDGLWRKNVTTYNSDWEYLGMSNDSLHWNSGQRLTDIVANATNSSELITAYHTSLLTEHHVYKTIDGGKSWFVSDSGLSYQSSFPPPYDEEIYYVNPTIFCQTPYGLYAIGGKVCHTDNFGESWNIISGAPYVNDFKLHRNFANVLIGGGSGIFEEPFLFYSKDYGNMWEYSIIDTLLTGWGVRSIALDQSNSELLYISLGTKILQSYDFGITWKTVYSSKEGVILCIEEDISTTGRLFASDGCKIVETVNFGKDWIQIENPIIEEIRSIIYDPEEKALYIGTVSGAAPYSGVFVYK